MNLKFLEPLKKIPQKDICQMGGFFSLNFFEPCCFGAHLAQALNLKIYTVDGDTYFHYADGKKAFLQRTGMSDLECRKLFIQLKIIPEIRVCDDNQYEMASPFDVGDWLIPMKEAIEKLERDGERVLKAIRACESPVG